MLHSDVAEAAILTRHRVWNLACDGWDVMHTLEYVTTTAIGVCDTQLHDDAWMRSCQVVGATQVGGINKPGSNAENKLFLGYKQGRRITRLVLR